MENLLYILINATYFASFAAIHAFAAVFLLDKGYNSLQIGFILAIANIISAILQPLIAGMADINKRIKLPYFVSTIVYRIKGINSESEQDIINKNPIEVSITNNVMIILLSVLASIGVLVLYFFSNNSLIVVFTFTLVFMLQMIYQPLITSLFFQYSKIGYKMNFGLGRGFGSVGYALASIYIGKCINIYGVNISLIFSFIVNVCFIISMLLFTMKKNTNISIDSEIERKNTNSLRPNEFIKKYPYFMIFLIAVSFIFFTHNMLCDFLIYVVKNIGYSEEALGYANSIQAFLELPAMLMVPFILKKVKPQILLLFSTFAFLLKIFLVTIAKDIGTIYISQALQMFSYAVFIPSVAYFVNMIMNEEDKIKGQAYVMCAMTISAVLSSLICGKILSISTVSVMLVVGSVSTVIGLVIEIIVFIKFIKKY